MWKVAAGTFTVLGGLASLIAIIQWTSGRSSLPELISSTQSGNPAAVDQSADVPKTIAQPSPGPNAAIEPAPVPESNASAPDSAADGRVHKTPAAGKSEWDEYSSAARQIVADDMLEVGEEVFGNHFRLECQAARESRRQFQAEYNSDVTVVIARFCVVRTATNLPPWTKTFEISATIDSGLYSGLRSDDTIQRVGKKFKEELLAEQTILDRIRKEITP